MPSSDKPSSPVLRGLLQPSQQHASSVERRSSTDSTSNTSSARNGERPRSTTTTSLSSAYKIPARSYLRRASHGAVDIQYASYGVREQTAELSSSLLGNEDFPVARPASRSRSHLDRPAARFDLHERSAEAAPEVIEEISEPSTPDREVAVFRTFNDDPSDIHGLNDSFPPLEPTEYEEEESFEDSFTTEASPLLGKPRRSSSLNKTLSRQSADGITIAGEGRKRVPRRSLIATMTSFTPLPLTGEWSLRSVTKTMLLQPIAALPAVFLGLLLNLLDALSYGIILFPLGEEAFSQMGPDGVSMFYVSCIVAQLTYSSGSIFRGGVGSEMVRWTTLAVQLHSR